MSFLATFRNIFFGCVRNAFSRRGLALVLCLFVVMSAWRVGELAMPLNYLTLENELCRAGFTPNHMVDVPELLHCRTEKGSAAFERLGWFIPLTAVYRVCSFEFEGEVSVSETALYRALDSADNDLPLTRTSLLAFDGRRALVLCRSEDVVHSRWGFRQCVTDILQRLDDITECVSQSLRKLAEPTSAALKETVLEPEYWPHWSSSVRNLPEDSILPVPFRTCKETPDPAKNKRTSMFIFYHSDCTGHENCRTTLDEVGKKRTRQNTTDSQRKGKQIASSPVEAEKSGRSAIISVIGDKSMSQYQDQN